MESSKTRFQIFQSFATIPCYHRVQLAHQNFIQPSTFMFFQNQTNPQNSQESRADSSKKQEDQELESLLKKLSSEQKIKLKQHLQNETNSLEDKNQKSINNSGGINQFIFFGQIVVGLVIGNFIYDAFLKELFQQWLNKAFESGNKDGVNQSMFSQQIEEKTLKKAIDQIMKKSKEEGINITHEQAEKQAKMVYDELKKSKQL